MLKTSYTIDITDLYNRWSKRHKPLFDSLLMEKEHNALIQEDEQLKNLNLELINESKLKSVDEAFVSDLKKRADYGRKQRSKFIKVFYQGVLKTKGWVHFRTSSQYTRGKHYYQYIRLEDIKDIKHLKGYKPRDIMRLLLSGHISCHCSCPDFLYRGFKYMGHTQKYGIYRERRYPKIRNPRLEGSVCKHLLAVFDVFMIHWTSISKDMFKSYYWKKRYKSQEDD